MASNPPSATLYLRNIDEHIKPPVLIPALHTLCSDLGTITEIIAKRNLRAKGQAFVVFETIEDAEDAHDYLQGMEFMGRKLVVQFAKTRSDAVVLREDGEEALEAWKRERLAEKERKQALLAEDARKKRAAEESANAIADRPAKQPKAAGGMADEYLPPNKLLILRDLPTDWTKDQITAAFAQFAGFKEFRPVPGRNMGFAEYEDEIAAGRAREAMNGEELGGKTVRVTFQRAAD